MPKYEYARIAKLAESLKTHRVPKAVIDKIMERGEDILKSTKPEEESPVDERRDGADE